MKKNHPDPKDAPGQSMLDANLFCNQIISSAQEGIIVYGLDLKYILWNPYMEHLSGFAARDVLGRHPLEVFPFLREAGVISRLERALTGETPEPIDFPFHVAENGLNGWASDTSGPLRNSSGEIVGIIGTVRDITDRKQAEQQLQQANDELEQHVAQRTRELQKSFDLLTSLSRQVPGVIFQFQMLPDGSYRLPYASEAIRDIYQVSPEDVMENAAPILERIHPEDYDSVLAVIRESARTLQPAQVEFRIDIPGQGLAWRFASAKPQRMKDGSIVWHGFSNDITERKQLEQQLIAARKLESIGQLAGGVAHEVRNPLNAILSVSEALFRETEIESNPIFEPYIQHIRTQVNRLALLMNDLLDLGKPIPAASLHPTPLDRFCRDTIAFWNSSGVPRDHDVTLEIDPESAQQRVMIDDIKLQQVFCNLIENATHHSPKGSRITIRIASPDLSSPGHAMAIIRINDCGAGIPHNKLSRIFDPFYSDRRGGTGLGLTLVKHFIENMGGSIALWNNDPPPGCTAELRIPLADKEQT